MDDIRGKTYRLWLDDVAGFDGIEIHDDPQTTAFCTWIASYGDLDDETTWETAWAELEAKSLAALSLIDDPKFAIEMYLIEFADREGYTHLVPAILKHLVKLPNACTNLAYGFSELAQHGCEYGATEAAVVQLFTQLQEIQNDGIQTDGNLAGKLSKRPGAAESRTSSDRGSRKEAATAGAD